MATATWQWRSSDSRGSCAVASRGRVNHARPEAIVSRPWTLVRSQYARAIQRGDSPEQVRALRAELRASRTEHYLRGVLAEDPPMTREQRRELAALLVGGDVNAA